MLRVPNGAATRDPGWQGNLMIMRLVGATLHLVAAEEYDAKGGYACALGIKVRVGPFDKQLIRGGPGMGI